MQRFHLRKGKLGVGDLDPLFAIMVTCTLVCGGLNHLEVAIVKIIELDAIRRVSWLMGWFGIDELGTIVAFNLDIIEATLGCHSDNWLISRMNWQGRRLLKE